jgi:hypothetical protein
MGSKRETAPLNGVASAYSGSAETFQAPRWRRGMRRSFELGDLVTLAPEFRYSIANASQGIDYGRYVGIVIQTYVNCEYMVVWTNHPLVATKFSTGLFNGDHLIKVENAEKALMSSK